MKKRILIIVCALLLCITGTFAWLSNFQANYVTNLKVDYKDGALKVVNLNFDAYIEARNEAGDFVRVPEGEPYKFDSKQMIPDSITPFKMKIKNYSTYEARKAKIGVAINIDPADAALLDMLYLEVVAGAGFDGTVSYHVFLKLGDAQVVGSSDSGEYFLWIYGDGSEIIIPSTNADYEYVTLDCSFYYDQDATAEYQNKSIRAMQFRVE